MVMRLKQQEIKFKERIKLNHKNTSFILFQQRTFILSKTRNLMPYDISPETFSIIHIFISRLSFPMPLAVSHFFYSPISARDI